MQQEICPQLELRGAPSMTRVDLRDRPRDTRRRGRRRGPETVEERARKMFTNSEFSSILISSSLIVLALTTFIAAANANLGSQEQKSSLLLLQQQQQLQLQLQTSSDTDKQPQAEALKAAKQAAPASGSPTSNVIIIKYANVTKSATSSSAPANGDSDSSAQSFPAPTGDDQYEVSLLKLYEPLSVSVIESRFAHSIQLFDVSQNQLSTLSNNLFCPLSNEVRLLNVSHNLLENFDSLGLISQTGQLCLNELRILDMSFNLIKHLPATGVASLHNLETLNLSNNLIESLDELSLSSLFRLIKLDLSFNRIQQLPSVLFQKSYSMQILRLQSNQLQISINKSFLAGLISLEELNLSENNISHVADSAFVDKLNLTRVDLTHNKLTNLRLEALRVTTGTRQAAGSPGAAGSSRQRIQHNGQYAPPAPRQTQSQSANAEFHLSANPFVCDCQLEWLRNFQHQQASSAIKSTVLTSPPSPNPIRPNLDSYGAQLLQLTASYQNDQPSVIPDASNNISEILTGSEPAGRPATQQYSQHQHLSQQYARIADLDLIKCSPLFRRNSQRTQHRNPVSTQANPSRALLAPSDGNHHHHHHHPAKYHPDSMIDLASADSSNFLCRYKSHCFALCHCCEFDACDCEMICPNGCNCYYDLTWKTNIIDCSSNNHTVVPDRIPMDVTGLYLDGNNIDSLKPSNLIARKSLKTLYLNSSNLQYIANRTFNGLIELQSLYLNENLLRSLQGHEFEPLSQLKALYLQSNRLDFISNQTFIYLRSLEILDLSNNRLTSNNLDLFRSVGHHNIRLRQLSIAHNWWSCQCNSVNKFRQILNQKFLNGGVIIADKNQLRCYYNSTTVGPLILQEQPAGALQQPLYGQHQLKHQPTLLTEINQCSDVIEDSQKYPQDNNPPLIQSQQEPEPPAPTNDYPSQDGYYPPPELERPYTSYNRYPMTQPPIADQPYPFPVPPSILTPNMANNQNIRYTGNSNSMPLTSFILLCMLCLVILVIATIIFVFVRQQQQTFSQNHHKKSSAASTTSASSSASSTAISSLNGAKSGARSQHHATLQYGHHHHPHHHHHLIMSNGSHGATTTSINHHHHSASSQSNIYAALVSPATGNSTTLANPAMNNNNLYSNSSTIASHHSSSPSQLANNNNNNNVNGYQATQNWQASVYNQQAYASGLNLTNHGDNHYTMKGSSQAASYKAAGSFYNSPGLSCQNAGGGGGGGQLEQHHQVANGDWMKLPKVKQFVSKLVSKSLALGRYRACSRDELSSITSDKIYDAFISYDKRDESFVMQHLSAELEYGQPQYRIADRFRDLPLPSSAYIAEAITSVIGCSHRTIVVLTENYLTSDWCRYELQAALHEASLDKSHKIIAVVLDPKCLLEMDNEMRALLTNCQLYQAASGSNQGQLLQLDNSLTGSGQPEQQLVATLNQANGGPIGSGSVGQVVVSTQTAQLATSKINFINYNERKFWQKIKHLMPQPRLSTQTLTLTTKN